MNKKDQGSQAPEGPLAPGTTAPDFSLHDTPDQTVSLSELRGRPVILVFYPADWSPVCGSELALYNELLPEFQRFGATLLGISVDGAWCHIAFVRDRRLKFPLLADFEPKGAVARAYGVYRQHDGIAERAAEAAEAAGSQGQFWAMHDLLFENQDALDDEDLVRYAAALGLHESRFVRELAGHVHAARVREDFMGGVRSGVNGTPTFFINGGRHDEPFDFGTLLRAIADEIAKVTG
ncbi:MAG: redoxin domain-containing protein [Candidatus Entotheonellia bacterium]